MVDTLRKIYRYSALVLPDQGRMSGSGKFRNNPKLPCEADVRVFPSMTVFIALPMLLQTCTGRDIAPYNKGKNESCKNFKIKVDTLHT